MFATPLAYWVVQFDPYLIRFTENIGIRYYGLAYVLSFLAGAWILIQYSKRGLSQLAADKVGDLMTFLVFGVGLGGRIGYYFLYDGWRSFSDDPWGVLRVWEGGMSFHGGLAGSAAALALYGWYQSVPFRHLGDLIASIAPLGLFLGRIANFINGELWGKISRVPWAMYFPRSIETRGRAYDLLPRHPSQLYEAGLEGVLLFAYLQWRVRATKVLAQSPGRLGGEFLIGYALCRIVCELFREPDEGISPIMGLSRGSFYSAIMVAVGLLFILWSWLKPGKQT